MKLFGIRDAVTNKVVQGEDFKTKDGAKRRRDEMNQQVAGRARYVVTKGPQHKDYGKAK